MVSMNFRNAERYKYYSFYSLTTYIEFIQLQFPSVIFTGTPFFQYFATLLSDPETYTSSSTTKIELAEALLSPFVKFTDSPFFQYLAKILFPSDSSPAT